jgi:proprotein convertase subtilisin/kexin type 5
LSPQTVRVRGWPKRQNTTYAQFTFRIFVAYLDKSDCPSGQWYDTTTEVCLNCASPCSTCKGSATTCTWCIANYVFIEKTSTCSPVMTTPDCPAGTIKDPYFSYCRNCPDFCSSCSSVTTCTACVKGYYLTTNTNGTITCSPPKSCPAGYRSDDANGCVACSSNCASCPSSSTCNLCMQGYYLDTTTKQCTQNCPAGYYGDSASRVCMICSPACATCVNNNYTCTSCRDIGGV